jgi:hypothetical protein
LSGIFGCEKEFLLRVVVPSGFDVGMFDEVDAKWIIGNYFDFDLWGFFVDAKRVRCGIGTRGIREGSVGGNCIRS